MWTSQAEYEKFKDSRDVLIRLNIYFRLRKENKKRVMGDLYSLIRSLRHLGLDDLADFLDGQLDSDIK